MHVGHRRGITADNDRQAQKAYQPDARCPDRLARTAFLPCSPHIPIALGVAFVFDQKLYNAATEPLAWGLLCLKTSLYGRSSLRSMTAY